MSGKTRWAIGVVAGSLLLLLVLSLTSLRAQLWQPLSVAAIRLYDVNAWSATLWPARAQYLETQKEQRRLEGLVSELVVDGVELKRLGEENQELKALLGYKQKTKRSLAIGTILAANLTTLRSELLVVVDPNARIKEGLGVITSGGVLFGVVERVESSLVTVRLLNDPRSKVAARVAGTPNSDGVVMPVEGGALALRLVGENVPLKPNDIITTSTLNDSIPADIAIGIVDLVAKESDTPFLRAIIDTAMDPMGLRTVAILIS